jgi:hypothetical protein
MIETRLSVAEWVEARRETGESFFAAHNRLWVSACAFKCACGRLVCYNAYFYKFTWACNKCYPFDRRGKKYTD